MSLWYPWFLVMGPPLNSRNLRRSPSYVGPVPESPGWSLIVPDRSGSLPPPFTFIANSSISEHDPLQTSHSGGGHVTILDTVVTDWGVPPVRCLGWHHLQPPIMGPWLMGVADLGLGWGQAWCAAGRLWRPAAHQAGGGGGGAYGALRVHKWVRFYVN